MPEASKVAQVEHHPAVPVAAPPALMRKLSRQAGIGARALEFVILTAARSGEVRGAIRAEIDVEAALWATENVFPGKRGPLSDMSLTAVLRRMKVSATVHGFRSSFRDWVADRTAYPSEVAEMALAHAVGDKVEAAYRRGDLLSKRAQLMTDCTNYLLGPGAAAG